MRYAPGVNLAAIGLAVVLGQAAPSPQPSPPAGEREENAGPTSTATSTPTSTSPSTAVAALRELRLTVLPGGGYRATLGGEPVEGPALYRAALRPDLAERLESRRHARTAALVLAGAAAAGGPLAGWVAFRAQGRSEQVCPSTSPSCEALNAQNRRDLRALGRRGLLVGGAAGVAVGGLALWWWTAHPAPGPDLAEAEALVRAYQARRAGEGAGLRLRLEPGPDGLAAGLAWTW